MAKISVLGAGSWGTALSILLYNNGHEVILWSALGEEITTLREKREHVSKLPGVKIPEPIDITIDLERSLRDTDVAILAVPSPYTRSTCKRMAPFVKNGQKIVNVAKGVEEKTLLTLSEIIEQELPQANVSVLSGPSHAEEVGKGLPTTCGKFSPERDSRISAGNLYEPCFQSLYYTGYAGSGAWRSVKECDRTGGRNRRWSGIRR